MIAGWVAAVLLSGLALLARLKSEFNGGASSPWTTLFVWAWYASSLAAALAGAVRAAGRLPVPSAALEAAGGLCAAAGAGLLLCVAFAAGCSSYVAEEERHLERRFGERRRRLKAEIPRWW